MNSQHVPAYGCVWRRFGISFRFVDGRLGYDTVDGIGLTSNDAVERFVLGCHEVQVVTAVNLIEERVVPVPRRY